MTTAAKGSGLIGLGIFVALVGRPARAADGPLLVVVEAPPALDADAAEIRRAIGAELRSETIAPMKTSAAPPESALIVALDRDRIAMSWRAGDATPVARSIPAPPEHAARLRAIAWLAGNLARDQVTPILAEAPPQMPSLATIPPAPTTAPATEPPPQPAAAAPAEIPPTAAGAPTISTQSHDPTAGSHSWSVGVADGPTSNFPLCYQSLPGTGRPSPCAPFASLGSAWRLELQRRSRSEGFFEGAALEGTAGGQFSPQLIGASAFIGSSRQHGKWSLESTFGAGLELSNSPELMTTSTTSSTTGFSSSTTVGPRILPALSADGAVAVAHPLSDSLDAILRQGVHISSDDVSTWFLSTTLGLRYNL